MTSPNPNPPSISNVCAAIKNLGYGTGQLVRLYGEEFEVASDPFPDAEGIAVHAKTTIAHGGVRGAPSCNGRAERERTIC